MNNMNKICPAYRSQEWFIFYLGLYEMYLIVHTEQITRLHRGLNYSEYNEDIKQMRKLVNE